MPFSNHRPFIFAHRGAMEEAPENTLVAFRLALEQGADGVELDVRLSADGEVVVLHDRFVDQMTNGSGKVDQLRLEELKRLDAGEKFDKKFQGEKIPTLREVFETIDHQALYDIELKAYIDSSGRLAEKVVRLVREFDLQDRVLFSCYVPYPLVQVRQRMPDSEVGLIFLKGATGAAQRLVGNWLTSDVIVPAVEEVTKETISREHERNRKVIPFTANSAETIRQLAEWKADGIITERPALAVQIVSDL